MTGTAAPGWSTLEDMECLGALATAYASGRAEKKAEPDPALETVERVIKDYMGGALVVYELGSRVDPQIGLKIDPKFQDLYRRYVRKYVLGVEGK